MSGTNSNESMLDMYIFETSQNIEQLEQSILSSEKSGNFTEAAINEIFRLMHTIKGSSAMMLFTNISTLAHSIEDLFYFLREQQPTNIDPSHLSDLVLDGIDFMKVELQKITNGDKADGEAQELIHSIGDFLELLKQNNSSSGNPVKQDSSTKQQYYIFSENSSLKKNAYKAIIFFKEGCEMENIRAYTIINNLKEFAENISYVPNDIIENEDSVQVIRDQGFVIYAKTDRSYEEMQQFLMKTIFLKDLELTQLEDDQEIINLEKPEKLVIEESPVKIPQLKSQEGKEIHLSTAQNIISVDVSKLDKLMDLVGEMVIAEAMVIQNPDLKGQEFENFHKASSTDADTSNYKSQ